MKKKRPIPQTTDERLDEILFHLEKFQARDKWRTFWGSIGGLVRLIPIAVTLYFAYYFYMHGEQIIADAIEASTNSFSARMSSGASMMQNTFNADALKEFFR